MNLDEWNLSPVLFSLIVRILHHIDQSSLLYHILGES